MFFRTAYTLRFVLQYAYLKHEKLNFSIRRKFWHHINIRVIILQHIYAYILDFGFHGLTSRMILFFAKITYIWCRVAGPWDPPPRRGKGHYVTSIYKTDTLPPMWYCGTSRVSWQVSRQQNMCQIHSKYTTPHPPLELWYFQSVRGKYCKSIAEHVPNIWQIHYPPPPLWYCGSSRVPWQASRQ